MVVEVVKRESSSSGPAEGVMKRKKRGRGGNFKGCFSFGQRGESQNTAP